MQGADQLGHAAPQGRCNCASPAVVHDCGTARQQHVVRDRLLHSQKPGQGALLHLLLFPLATSLQQWLPASCQNDNRPSQPLGCCL
jgi:hypothetical protein